MKYEMPKLVRVYTLSGMESRLDSRCMSPRLCSALTVAALVPWKPWAESGKIKSEKSMPTPLLVPAGQAGQACPPSCEQ